jgi:hypothetical protein
MLLGWTILRPTKREPRRNGHSSSVLTRWLRIVLIVVLGTAALGPLSAQPAQTTRRFQSGTPLTEALLQLQQAGLKLVFSSQLVRPEMKVEAEPRSLEPRKILSELLAPHGLDVREGPGGVLIVVPGPLRPAPHPFPAAPIRPRWSEEIVVQPSRISLLVADPAAPVHLTREEMESLPHLGEDVFRTLSLLPGTSSSDISAQFHIRGARRDELLILLDGQELYEPYHLRDFDNALSIVAASALARASLTTAAFPVSYGDRMAGVLDMQTIEPPARRRLRLNASLVGAQVEAGESYRGGTLGWFASARRGTLDILGRLFELEEPSFWDFFAKVDSQLTPRQNLRIHGLASRDNLLFADEKDEPIEGESKNLDTEYDSTYLWLTHRIILNQDLFVDSALSTTRVRRDRRGTEQDPERSFEVRDERRLDVTSFHHSWNLERSARQFLHAGVEYRKFEAFYDYFSFRQFTTPLASLRSGAAESTFALRQPFGSEHLSLYASDRLRPLPALTLELGLRYDQHTAVDDDILSPRFNAAWGLGTSSVLRLGWGHFSQSHRAYELMVEDGDSRFYPAERSDHWVVGVEHIVAPLSRLPLSSLRVEAYRRTVASPRPRYENLFKPFDAFPEGEFDRVRIEPHSARAEGAELYFRGRATPRFDWWLNYAYASTRDRIDGRNVPRGIDQRQTLNLDVNYRPAPTWNLNVAWAFRTGWPTTPLTLVDGSPVLGALNSARLHHYHRLDARLSHEWAVRSGTLTFFLDARNLYDRRNVAGLDITFDPETSSLVFDNERWPGFLASAGVTWELR